MNERRRIANVTEEEHCEHCLDDGVITVGSELRNGVEFDVAGPCARCEKGFRVEYGIGRNKDGTERRAKRPPWGGAGYWRGKS
jgi:hypothetical protein